MANRRNIRKRQFEANKSLRFYRDTATLYQYLNGEGANENDMNAFEMQEKYENRDKITEMLFRKKRDVIIPEINYKNDKGEASEKSANTDITKDLLRSKEEDRAPIDFKFKPMGPPPLSYIKYKPKMSPLGLEQNYNKIDYMITEEEWAEVSNSSKNIPEGMKDLVEEMFDKFEKQTAKGEIQPMDKYKQFTATLPLLTKSKPPTDAQFKAIYNAWVHLRKKAGNALLRMFYRKPDPNDNSPTASFRSRVPEKMQTRRKNKNDQSNYMKLKILRREIYAGRQLLADVMKREKLKMAQLDLDYYELKQMLKEKMDPTYQCPEFKEFIQNEDERVAVELPKELAPQYRPEEEDEKLEERKDQSQFDVDSIKSSKYDKKLSKKDSVMDRSSVVGGESDINSEIYSQNDLPPKPIPQPLPSEYKKEAPTQEKAHIDYTTAMEIAIMFRKIHYFGIQVDPHRIKISTHKPIKKEDYLNLPQAEIEEEQYYRSGTKPKSQAKVDVETTAGVKYTIFRARSGRIMILRKAKGGKYEVYNEKSHSQLHRIKPETASCLKRLKMTEDDEYEGTRNTLIPVLQDDVNNHYSPYSDLDTKDEDEEMADEEKKDEVDDYTEGFIFRHRKRKGKKRGNSDLTISFKVQNY